MGQLIFRLCRARKQSKYCGVIAYGKRGILAPPNRSPSLRQGNGLGGEIGPLRGGGTESLPAPRRLALGAARGSPLTFIPHLELLCSPLLRPLPLSPSSLLGFIMSLLSAGAFSAPTSIDCRTCRGLKAGWHSLTLEVPALPLPSTGSRLSALGLSGALPSTEAGQLR